MPATTKNVFLDTEIFDRHNLDVFSPHFKRLIRLAEAEELRLILSSEEKQKRDDELTQARKDLQKFRQETWYDESSRYIRRRNELMEPVNARVNDAIWRVAQDKGLDVVFDTVSGNLVYVKPAYDLTELVLEELKK